MLARCCGLLALWCWLALALPVAGAPAAQYVARRVELTLSVADVQRAADGITEAARLARGRFVDQQIKIQAYSDGAMGLEATLKVPPEMLETALVRLRGLALEVLSEELQSDDVSSQVSELNARLTQLRASRRRLRDLLERAGTGAERRQVEAALSEADAEVAGEEADLAALRQETDWAAIHILARQAPPTPAPTRVPAPSRTPRPTTVPIKPSPAPWEPGKTLGQALDAQLWLLRHSTDLFIVVTVVGGPYLALGLVLWFIRRARA
jgi:outer membrane murein-binding lipoprotein Lpp